MILTHWEGHFSQPMRAVTEGDMTFFTLGDEPLQDPANRMLKRCVDIMIALPVVLFILPFLSIWVHIMQRWQAPGPLLYRQERGGLAGQAFPVLKFRTMYTDNGGERRVDEGRQATRGDPRIYPFGHFLRRTSLDEFPQFINVLRGHMSVVGPRPHLIAHDQEFSRYAELYRNRHFAKPGITGMAQHLGYRGEVSKPEDIQNRVRLDLEYIRNWSIWLDVGIVFKTTWHMVFPPPGAV